MKLGKNVKNNLKIKKKKQKFWQLKRRTLTPLQKEILLGRKLIRELKHLVLYRHWIGIKMTKNSDCNLYIGGKTCAFLKGDAG